MLDDLFSHKIHASRDIEAWQINLVRLATIFSVFDNKQFNRDAFDASLKTLAPQAARSPFRDQYSIYLSIFGVGKIIWNGKNWICQISNTARHFLLGVEPNIEAFCRLQLALYQRPDARGQKYNAGGLDMEHQSHKMTLNLIKQGYRLCPFRLILKLFEAKAIFTKNNEDDVTVTPDEIYTMANLQTVYQQPSPKLETLVEGLEALHKGKIPRPKIGRKTFKFLESTGLLSCDSKDHLRLVECSSIEQRQIRDGQIHTIRNLNLFYDNILKARNKNDLINIVKSGGWAKYFDAFNVLSASNIDIISGPDLVITGGSIVDLSPLELPVITETEPSAPTPRPSSGACGSGRTSSPRTSSLRRWSSH